MFTLSHANPMQSVFVALLLMIFGIITIQFIKSPNKAFLIRLFTVAFFIRVIFVYIIFYYFNSVGGDGFAFNDDRVYDRNARIIASALNKGLDGYEIFSWHQNPGYFQFNGWLYSILGADTFSARVINSFLSSLTVIFIFEITRISFTEKIAKTAGYLVAFMPNMIFWSTLQFKDTSLVFVMVYTSYLLVVNKDKKLSIMSILLMIGSLVLMWGLRKDYALPYIGIVLIWLMLRYTGLEGWFNSLRRQGLSAIVGGFMIIIGGGALAGLASTSVGQDFLQRYTKITDDNASFAENASSSEIGFSRRLRINSIQEMYKLPFAVSFTTIIPLPLFGQLTNGKQVGVAVYSMANLAFIVLLPYVVLGFMLTKTVSLGNSIILRWFPLSVLIGVSILFMGVLRYKEQMMPFFLIWAAVALSQKKKYKNKILMMYFLGGASIVFALVLAISSKL